MSPTYFLFIAFLRKNRRKFSKFGVLCLAIYFEKISQNFSNISWDFFNFFKIEKTIIFAPKIVQNHYINHKLAKISLKTPKISQFYHKNRS